MSFSNLIVSNSYIGNGIDMTFNITFTFLEGEDQIGVKVYDNSGSLPVEVVPTPLFTIDEDTKQVTFTAAAPLATEEVILYRESATTQEVDYNDFRFPYATVERHFDRVFLLLQEHDKMLESGELKDFYNPVGNETTLTRVSDNDTTAGYLLDKISVSDEVNAGGALEITEVNDGADETLKISFDESKITIEESQISDLSHYSHPNHSGEVSSTGDGAQVLESPAITNKPTVPIDGGDFLLVSDSDDSGALKKYAVSDFLPLISGGGGTGTFSGFNLTGHTTGIFAASTGDLVYLPDLTNAVTVELPAGAVVGDEVVVKESSGAYANKTIDGNGNTIVGVGATYTLQSNYESIRLVFSAAGWLII